jgi:nucleoside-diphosphate-sugar epimerase
MLLNYDSICITGATGFIGQHLLDRLEKESRLPVRILTRNPKRFSSRTFPSHFTLVQGDLEDQKSLLEFISNNSLVIHLAYLSGRPAEVNLAITRNLTHACQKAEISRFIHVSTAVVVGKPPELWVTEETPCRPVSDYEKTKLAIEDMISNELHPPKGVAILRPTCVFGDGGQNLLKLIHDLKNTSPWVRYLKASLFKKRSLNLVPVENVVGAILHLATYSGLSTSHAEKFIVSEDDSSENNFWDVSQLILSKNFPRPLPVVSNALPFAFQTLKPYLPHPYTRYSPQKLLQTGYQRTVDFRSGLISFLKKQPAEFTPNEI